ncbi:hybrid sensor histidine kinase/response regulator [Puniceibacterium confluentis]|uniref:hybrid sensor histidine kinase/response regulator n=1 Tax=Puniceibacterium confluentis TaxID=1958944 RepID=UPI0011B3EA7C|nr:ATP-binding protein [Puniceibacterium confluentis]
MPPILARQNMPQLLRRAALTLAAGLMVAGILVLGASVRKELQALATTGSDNIEWALSQAEVEAIALSQEALTASHAPDVPLDLVRLRFDLLYSRVKVLEEGPLFAGLRTDPEVAKGLARVETFLMNTAPLIDGPEAQLRPLLTRLSSQAETARHDLRDIALQGIAHFAEISDVRREKVAATLRRVAALTVALVALLGITVMALMRLNLLNHRVAESERQTRSRLQAILTTALDGILVTDRNGVLRGCNTAAERMFGYPRDSLLELSLSDLVMPDALPGGLAPLSGQGLVQCQARHSDGAAFPIEMSVSAAEGPDSPIHVAFVRNISNRVAAEKALRRAHDIAVAGDQAKADLLAVMSHEMRTPLNGLLGTLDLLRREELNDRMKRYAAIMERSGQLLLRHVEDVLGIAQAEAGQLTVLPEPLDLNALIAELVEAQAGQAEQHGNQLIAGAPEAALAQAWGDPLRLRQMLLNLIGNALKFTENGTVTVEAEALDGLSLVELRVIDTGIGITEVNRARIFEDFVTLDASYRRSNGGTGLGLGITRRMVQAMAGEIGVESEPGEGSLFWIRLPLAPPVDGAKEPDCDVPRGLRVLLVEDDQINRFVARDMLESDGHVVTEATDGAKGVAEAECARFDLILMDVSMPQMDGVRATREIRAGGGPSAQSPILGLTAHAQPAEVERFRNAGMTEVLQKPVTQAVLRRMIARALKASGSDTFQSGQVAAWQARSTPLLASRIRAELRAAVGEHKFAQLNDAFIQDAVRFFSAPPDDLALQAHRLAGVAAVLGAQALNVQLQALESAAGNPEEVADALRAARECWLQTLSQVTDGDTESR